MAIKALIKELERSWNAGDGTRWAANFTETAVFVDVLGRIQRGRGVIGSEHQKLFDSIYRGSHLEIAPLDSRPADADLVLAHTSSVLRVPTGPRAGDTPAVQTMLVDGGLIVAFQNTIRPELSGFAGDDEQLADLAPLGWEHAG